MENLNITRVSFAVFSSAILSPVSLAIVVDGANGDSMNNRTESSLLLEHPEFLYWDNMVNIGGASGIYLGQDTSGNIGYVLTAEHTTSLSPGSSVISVAGSNLAVLSATQIGGADLKLYGVGGGALPNLPSVTYASTDPSYGDEVVMFGRSNRISDLVTFNGNEGYQTSLAPGSMSWGANEAQSVFGGTGNPVLSYSSNGAQQENFYTSFDSPMSGSQITGWEASAATYDSGGAAFVYRNGQYELAGIISAVLRNRGQSSSNVAYGNKTSLINIEHYSKSLPELSGTYAIPEPSNMLLLVLGVFQAVCLRRRN